MVLFNTLELINITGETKTVEFILSATDLVHVNSDENKKQGAAVQFNINEQIHGQFTFTDQASEDP
jgi:hypothetical protein